MNVMGVPEAASRLGVGVERVRQLIYDGRLSAQQVSGRWLVDVDSVARHAGSVRKAGRPFAPARAWGLLALASGRRPEWLSPRARAQLDEVLNGRGIGELHHLLGQRAQVRQWYVHPSMVADLLMESGVVVGGARASGVLRSDGPVEIYLAADQVDRLVGRYRPDRWAEDPNVVVRSVCCPWPFAPGERQVWPVVAAVDLLDHPDDDRSMRAGRELLARLA